MVKQQKFLHDAERALVTVRTVNDIRNILVQYGYDSSKIQEGISIYNRVEDLLKQQHTVQANLKDLSRTLRESCIAINIFYERHQELLVASFREAKSRQAEIPHEKGKVHHLPQWLMRMHHFYEYFTTEVAARHGISAREMEQVRNLLYSINRLEMLKRHTDIQLQQASRLKKGSLEELEAWMHKLERVAKTAFFHHPELLKALGFAMKAQ